jgi:hypothetical protein
MHAAQASSFPLSMAEQVGVTQASSLPLSMSRQVGVTQTFSPDPRFEACDTARRWFYGGGVTSPAQCELQRALRGVYAQADVNVDYAEHSRRL